MPMGMQKLMFRIFTSAWQSKIRIPEIGIRPSTTARATHTMDYAAFVPLDSEVLRDQICTT